LPGAAAPPGGAIRYLIISRGHLYLPAMNVKETHGKCLNCGHDISGKFCPECGQKTNLPHDSFGHMLVHFVSDYFHYDGKFWTTIKTLFTKPGQLTLEYIQGKRASYLQPVQLYIFVSAVFFLVFFQLIHINVSSDGNNIHAAFSREKLQEHDMSDSAFAREERIVRSDRTVMLEGKRDIDSTYAVTKPEFSKNYMNVFMAKKIIEHAIRNKQYTSGEILESVMTTFLHSIPKLFFILMPVFALLLKWYFRRREYVYVDHAIMSLHLHAFLFTSFIVASIFSFLDTQFLDFIFIILIPILYFFLAFHRFYKFTWLATALRGLLTLGSYIIIVILAGLVNLFLLMVVI
jgi:hypothetical protein